MTRSFKRPAFSLIITLVSLIVHFVLIKRIFEVLELPPVIKNNYSGLWHRIFADILDVAFAQVRTGGVDLGGEKDLLSRKEGERGFACIIGIAIFLYNIKRLKKQCDPNKVINIT